MSKNIFGMGLMLNVVILRLIGGLEMAIFEPKIVFLGRFGHFAYVYAKMESLGPCVPIL